MANHSDHMAEALRLAKRAYGFVSPNPMVGAVLVKRGAIIGRGWHKGAGNPHAEVEALRDCERRGQSPVGATLFVTLEPCCTHGRTPPCTEAIIKAGIRRVVVGATDPNPHHAGKGYNEMRDAGIKVRTGVLGELCTDLNPAFNHWIVHRTPFVTVKAAMSLDGKIATRTGESRWITSEPSRAWAMQLRRGSDAILVGIKTILTDDPALTLRNGARMSKRQPRRIVLDSLARTPRDARLLKDEFGAATIIVVSERAPKHRVARLSKRARVMVAPSPRQRSNVSGVSLNWLLQALGSEDITSVLVEGGGEVNASFLSGGFAHRIAFFYAPKIIGGRAARTAVAGEGAARPDKAIRLSDVTFKMLGPDLLLTAAIKAHASTRSSR